MKEMGKIRVALLSWSGRSRWLYELLQRSGRYEVVQALENDFSKWGRGAASAGRVMELYREGGIDRFLMPSMDEGTNDVYRDLMEFYQVPGDDFWYAPNSVFCEKEWTDGQRLAALCRFADHRELETLEVHVADHCNLRCKNCTMMAPLVDHPVFPDFGTTVEGLRKFKEFFDHVKIFRILGGEPLLNPELGKYIRAGRELFPYADLRLATNGRLLLHAPEELLECLRDCRATLYISYYCLPGDRMEEVHHLLDERGISHFITKTMTAFQKVYNLKGDTDRDFSFSSCEWRKNGCQTLKGHELSVCFVPTVIHYLRERFGADIPDDGRLDLFTEGLTTQKIRDFLAAPFETCRFCTLRGHLTGWEQLTGESREVPESWSI